MLTACAIAVAAQDWSLHYERSGHLETGRYAEAVEFCRRLDRASDQARLIEFGKSPQGRPMVALHLSKGAGKRPVVLVINGIHSGEIEGKDASLILAREILVTKKEAALLDGADLLIVPVFSVDAHERFGPYHRINQNGPKEMGWRATAQNLNLNRDFTKADAPEMRAMIRLVNRWRPDFAFDNHTTDGADYRYVLTYGVPTGPTTDPEVAAWSKRMIADVMPRVEADGFLTAPYFNMADRSDPAKGISVSDYSPRYSTGYFAALNRPSMLVETHMLKPYRPRVESTYSVMKHVIEFIGRTSKDLRAAVDGADRRAAAAKPGDEVVLESRPKAQGTPFVFKGFEYRPTRSEVSGAEVAGWSRTPIDVATTYRGEFEATTTVKAPAGYLVPQEWGDVVERLRLHGVEMRPLPRADRFKAEAFRADEVRFPPRPFEGRFQPTVRGAWTAETCTAAKGDLFVPVSQARSRLVLHLLEPSGPDSFLAWGFFNAMFEQKEYAEDYAMEPYARRMLDQSPELRKEFIERLKDEAFAKSPSERLDFFYRRSPFWDLMLNRYPVLRLGPEAAGALSR